MGQEFPNGERVIFLGSMAYGTAAQVASTTKDTLDISLAVSSHRNASLISQYFPTEYKENSEFTRIVVNRPSGKYFPSPVLARRLGISALALSRITSTLMVQLSDGSKTNIGLSLKFESKGLKVLGFSKRNDRGWEFSETTALALERYKAAFPEAFHNLDSRGGGEFSRCQRS
jgi:5'-3' exoribonuclease 1